MTKEEKTAYNAVYYLKCKNGIPRRKPLTKEERKIYMKAYSAAYYLAHKGPPKRRKPIIDEVRAKKREWNKRNPEVLRKAGSKWTTANPHKANEKTMRRYAKKTKASPSWLTKEQRDEMRKIYKTAQDSNLVVDHIVPLRGETVSGLHVPWNLQLLTKAENSKKGNRLWI